MRSRFVEAPGWLVSLLVHLVGMLVLAMINVPPPQRTVQLALAWDTRDDPPIEELTPIDIPQLEIPPEELKSTVLPGPTEPLPPDHGDGPSESPPGPPEPPGPEIGTNVFGPTGGVAPVPGTGGLPGNRLAGFNESRGTPEGSAVGAGLDWIVRHQLADGGWSFAHGLAPGCRGQCRSPGDMGEARIAATSLALLPLLGAGQTHKHGQYQKPMRAGLRFLVGRMRRTPEGGSLYEPGGRMYSHGLASIALCEAYAMTRDKDLLLPAQSALAFIASAQDPAGGGWRYEPRQAGDTSVFGWQIMAMKSGHMSYLQVPQATVRRAQLFLNTVQADNGSRYGYLGPEGSSATTAIGLLCRMHLGWKRDNPSLERGVQWLAARGPSPGEMYYNYYATQVLHHWEGELWERWWTTLRNSLLVAQARSGHEKGSWMLQGDHGSAHGGRLYSTAMATMTLEVKYRVAPLYTTASVENFPID